MDCDTYQSRHERNVKSRHNSQGRKDDGQREISYIEWKEI